MHDAPRQTALIIDDDPVYRKFMGETLERSGWHVLTAEEGEAGIQLAKTHAPAVVICDLLMPRCNGFQVCRALRNDPALRQTRIIISSGRQFETDRQAAFAAGADEYLTKPIEPNELLRLISIPPVERHHPATRPVEAVSAEVTRTRVTFWGVRGSIPTPGPGTVRYGGNTSCVEVRTGDQILVLDAGTGLRLLGRQLAAEFDGQPLALTLLLTHTHWDHIQGLPFFLPVYEPQNHLRILGYEGARHGLDNVLTGQMESPFFPIGLREVPANVRIEELKDLSFTVGKVRVEAWFANHPGICVGYRLFTPGGSVAFFPDNEPYGAHRHAPASGAGTAAAEEFARAEERKLAGFLRGTDLLIMDAQYDRQEYEQHIGWGHGCPDDVVALALAAQVKRLCLFHHDPDHDDATIDRMVGHARELVTKNKGMLEVEAAREGATIELVP
jgi:phosphoribosyl 1,2-cyclic phosphodiesterase/ActR/RegA family two-component response regulator